MGHDSLTDGKQNLQKEQEHPTNLAKGLHPQVVLKTKERQKKQGSNQQRFGIFDDLQIMRTQGSWVVRLLLCPDLCSHATHHHIIHQTCPPLFLFLPAGKGKMTAGLRKLREEESYRLLTTFKRKFVQWNLWAMGIIFQVLPDLLDGKRWWQTTKKKKKKKTSERRSGRCVGSDGERGEEKGEPRGRRQSGK